jgi:alanine or glycine:cation symporter, AGCS family
VIWDIADTLNGLMAAPNLIALIALAGVLAQEKDTHMAALAATSPAAGED